VLEGRQPVAYSPAGLVLGIEYEFFPTSALCSPVKERVVLLWNFGGHRVGVRIVSEVRSIAGFAGIVTQNKLYLPNRRHEECWQFFLGNLEPVKRLEPSVIFNVVCSVLQAPVTLRHITD
jgi:hypothetical protein